MPQRNAEIAKEDGRWKKGEVVSHEFKFIVPAVITRTLPFTRPWLRVGVFFETTGSVIAAWEMNWQASKQISQAVFPKANGREDEVGVRVTDFMLGTTEGRACKSPDLADSSANDATNPQNSSIFVV